MCQFCAFASEHAPAATPVDCPASGSFAGDDGFQVNNVTSGDQNGFSIGRLMDGRFVVLYESGDTPGQGVDLRARLFNADGSPAGVDFIVNQNVTAGDQINAGVTVGPDGVLSILWQTPDIANTGNFHLMARRFDAAGKALDAEHQLSVSGADGSYTWTQRPNGVYFLAYFDDGDIKGRTFDANWNPLTPEVTLNTTVANFQGNVGLLTLTNGNLQLRFNSEDDGDGGGGSGNVIRNRIFATTGDSWTPVSIAGTTDDFIVNTTGAQDQAGPRAIRLGNGSVLEFWNSEDLGDGAGSCIRARIIPASGDPTAASPDFILNTTAAGEQLRGGALPFDDGRRLIWWHSLEDGANDVIRGRWIASNGVLDAADFVITTLPGNAAAAFTMLPLANQHVVFFLQSPATSDGSGDGIQANLHVPTFPSPGEGGTANPGFGATLFDAGLLHLPSYDTTQAAAQISRFDAPFNDALGSPHTLTYSYAASLNGETYSNGASGFSQFNAQQIAAAEQAIALWEDVANIDLVRVQDPGSAYSDAADFRLWNYASATPGSAAANAAGFGGWSFAGGWRHRVSLNDDRAVVTAPTDENGGTRLYLHEIGHALGLSHPGNYNIGPTGSPIFYDVDALYRQDTGQYTVMSYFDETITHANFAGSGAASPLLHDIAAAQRLYGADLTTRTGDTIYGFNSNAGRAAFAIASATDLAVFAIWDAGGVDTLDLSGYGMNQTIDLRQEMFSSAGGLEFNIAIARGAVIENADGGAGSDVILGNAIANRLVGHGGDDRLRGDGGADLLIGGAGSDMADYGPTALSVVVFLNGAADAVVTVGGAAEDIVREIENVAGGAANDVLVGDGLSNILIGDFGADYLFSRGFNGDGTMMAGAGNDIFYGGAGADGIFAGDGNDALAGDDGDDGLVGGAGNDSLDGGAGADFLFGGGFSPTGAFLAGSGADTLNGGAGNDGLWGFDGADILNGDGDNDYVDGGAGADTLNGGAGNDYVLGQSDNDSVAGGAGFDYLYGGAGADTFIFRKGDSADWILDFSAAQGDRLRFLDFGYANFAAVPLVDLSTPGNPAVQLTFIEGSNVDQLTIFGVTLAQLNAGNVLVT